MSLTAPESFGQRVDAVFGALGQSSAGQGSHWSLSREQVFRSGRNDDSSEEEEMAAEPGGSLLDADEQNVHRDLQGNIVQPSFAFCRALDNEQEYDEVDAVAGTSTSDLTDAKPHRLTEVLDDNAFERRMRSHLAAGSSYTQPEVMQTGSSAHGNISHQSEVIQRRKPQSVHSAVQGRHQRRSTVPDHVRHPDKYTCYVLDEPLVVGGGERGSGTHGSRAELEQAARAASSAAAAGQMPAQDEEQRQDLPAFGAGIEFRPRKKARQQNKTEAVAGLNNHVSGLAAADEHSEEAVQSDDEAMTDSPKTNLKPTAAAKPRRRQYRTKPGIS